MTITTRTRPRRHLRTGAVMAAAASIVVLPTGCRESGERASGPPAGQVGGRSAFTAGLVAFGSCQELLDYYRSKAEPLVGAYGLAGAYGLPGAYEATARGATDSASTGRTAPASAAAGSPDGFSGTNNQESGVDEADTVKTDGRIIVTSLNGRIQITDAAAAKTVATVTVPRSRGGASSELLLSGDTLIVLSTSMSHLDARSSADVADGRQMGPGATRTTVTRVDVSDPAAAKVLGAVRLEGSYRSARMIGDSVRMVMVSDPTGLRFTYPKDESLRAEEEALRANKATIEDSTIEDWLPHVQVLDAAGESTGTTPLMDCTKVSRPQEFAGLTTLSVLTFDAGSAGGSLAPTSTVGVVAGGDTVYASTDTLLVATSPWNQWGPWQGIAPTATKMTTALHAFDISDRDVTTYAGSGTVPGRLVNQFAMDEERGVIRVATTTSGPEWGKDSQSSLFVLRQRQEELVTVGHVDGMGLSEHIRSVRYLSPDLAAVVTFRQTDPLYLVDTSDPSKPRVAGELKIPGYSAYLHPVGDGLLLGIGQDADPKNGRTKGLQASLFDVSDPRKPARVGTLTWKDSTSPAEWDHRAFLWWKGTAYLPAMSWGSRTDKGFGGIVTVDVSGRALREGRRVSTARKGWEGEGPQRLLVIGTDLWTVDHLGLQRFDLATFERVAVVPMPPS